MEHFFYFRQNYYGALKIVGAHKVRSLFLFGLHNSKIASAYLIIKEAQYQNVFVLTIGSRKSIMFL